MLTMLDWSPRPELVQSTSQRRSTAQIFAIVEERVFELGRPFTHGESPEQWNVPVGARGEVIPMKCRCRGCSECP